jgi:hypothetical protein
MPRLSERTLDEQVGTVAAPAFSPAGKPTGENVRTTALVSAAKV